MAFLRRTALSVVQVHRRNTCTCQLILPSVARCPAVCASYASGGQSSISMRSFAGSVTSVASDPADPPTPAIASLAGWCSGVVEAGVKISLGV